MAMSRFGEIPRDKLSHMRPGSRRGNDPSRAERRALQSTSFQGQDGFRADTLPEAGAADAVPCIEAAPLRALLPWFPPLFWKRLCSFQPGTSLHPLRLKVSGLHGLQLLGLALQDLRRAA